MGRSSCAARACFSAFHRSIEDRRRENMFIGLRLSVLLLIALPSLPAEVNFPAARQPTNDVHLDNYVPIRMRDGVVLYADVYRPVGAGKYPVVVSRTPYSTERTPNAYAAGMFFARRGYVFVFQD